MDIIVQILAFITMTLLIVSLIVLFFMFIIYGTFIAVAIPLLVIAGISYGIYLLFKKFKPTLTS